MLQKKLLSADYADGRGLKKIKIKSVLIRVICGWCFLVIVAKKKLLSADCADFRNFRRFKKNKIKSVCICVICGCIIVFSVLICAICGRFFCYCRKKWVVRR